MGAMLLQRLLAITQQHVAARSLCSGLCRHARMYSEDMQREQMDYDVCIVGAGPAGLSAAIRLKQLANERSQDVSVCVLEKGAEIGAHILSGNVLEPRALDELLPDWREQDAPVTQAVTQDRFYFLTGKRAIRLLTPRQMHNKGNFIISLSQLVRWLGSKAEEQGVDVFPGFAASKVLFDGGAVCGVATNDFGIAKDGSRKDSYTPGVDLRAKVTLFAEGARGSLSQKLASDPVPGSNSLNDLCFWMNSIPHFRFAVNVQLMMKHFNLRSDCCPQTYALGLKEVWQVDPDQHKPGQVIHTVGYPLPYDVYGGSWIYHMADGLVSLGYVVGLDYKNPYLSPYQEFQQFKRHPLVATLLQGGTCLQYGARTLNEGGWQSVPKLVFPGGALLGCSAGFLNVPKIKGTHTAMKSGMLAAEATIDALAASPSSPITLQNYQAAYEQSWIYDELHRERNIRPSFNLFGGLLGGIAYSAVDTYLLRGGAPWTFRHRHADHERLRPAAESSPREYPKPDGELTFDVATSLYRSGTNHDHDQVPHLQLRHAGVPQAVNLPIYAGPESRYCPAGVYEYVPDEHEKQQLQVNAQNCLHCKACDIKDPRQNIQWTVPEGGGGPSYTVM